MKASNSDEDEKEVEHGFYLFKCNTMLKGCHSVWLKGIAMGRTKGWKTEGERLHLC